VTSTHPGEFAARDGRDVVSGAQAPGGLVVLAKDTGDQLTLSAPWPGAAGQPATVGLTFHHDLRNYAVHFSMPVQ
jgi:hypothetical protein